jgi:hypothetical protein
MLGGGIFFRIFRQHEEPYLFLTRNLWKIYVPVTKIMLKIKSLLQKMQKAFSVIHHREGADPRSICKQRNESVQNKNSQQATLANLDLSAACFVVISSQSTS